MIITLKRIYFKGTFTLGALQIRTENNPEYLVSKYFCDTLEPHAIDWSKEEKVAGKTAIPCGRYRVTLRYSRTFKRKMPYLENVPHFTGIMLHTGNTAEKHSRGCILVGKAVPPSDDDTSRDKATVIGRLTDSRITFKKLYKLIEEAFDYGESVWVVVK